MQLLHLHPPVTERNVTVFAVPCYCAYLAFPGYDELPIIIARTPAQMAVIS